MNNKLQDLASIAPMADSPAAGPTDSVKKEYEDGKRMFQNRNYGEAAVAFHNVLVAYEEKGDDNGIANASNQIGLLCMEKEDFEGALKNFTRAKGICEKLNDPLSVFALCKNFIDVYVGLKQYDKAVETCLDLLDVYQDNNDPRGAVAVLERIAEIYIQAGDKEKAADTYRTVASVHRNFKHKSLAEGFDKKAEELQAGS